MKLVLIATTDDDDLAWVPPNAKIAVDPKVTEFELTEVLMKNVIGQALISAIARAVVHASTQGMQPRERRDVLAAKQKAAAAAAEPDPFG